MIFPENSLHWVKEAAWGLEGGIKTAVIFLWHRKVIAKDQAVGDHLLPPLVSVGQPRSFSPPLPEPGTCLVSWRRTAALPSLRQRPCSGERLSLLPVHPGGFSLILTLLISHPSSCPADSGLQHQAQREQPYTDYLPSSHNRMRFCYFNEPVYISLIEVLFIWLDPDRKQATLRPDLALRKLAYP